MIPRQPKLDQALIVRCDRDLKTRIAQFAKDERVSVSVALRYLIERALPLVESGRRKEGRS